MPGYVKKHNIAHGKEKVKIKPITKEDQKLKQIQHDSSLLKNLLFIKTKSSKSILVISLLKIIYPMLDLRGEKNHKSKILFKMSSPVRYVIIS